MEQQLHSNQVKKAAAAFEDPPPAPSVSVPRQLRTRRQLWLTAHPEYLAQTSHALALPLAYDRLIRNYQTPAERQEEGRRQGWARTLEGALVRGEAKRGAAVRQNEQREENEGLERQARPVINSTVEVTNGVDSGCEPVANGGPPHEQQNHSNRGLRPLPEELDEDEIDSDDRGESSSSVRPVRGGRQATDDDGDAIPDSQWDIALGVIPTDELFGQADDSSGAYSGTSNVEESAAASGELPADRDASEGRMQKETARLRWEALLTARFIAGADEDFDYEAVDRDDALECGWREARKEEEWFEDESEAWASDVTKNDGEPLMQTGIQDF